MITDSTGLIGIQCVAPDAGGFKGLLISLVAVLAAAELSSAAAATGLFRKKAGLLFRKEPCFLLGIKGLVLLVALPLLLFTLPSRFSATLKHFGKGYRGILSMPSGEVDLFVDRTVCNFSLKLPVNSNL